MERGFRIGYKTEVNQMSVTGITDQMMQYERGTEVIYSNKSKHPKAYGVKRPEAVNIIAVLTALFVVVVVFAQSM